VCDADVYYMYFTMLCQYCIMNHTFAADVRSGVGAGLLWLRSHLLGTGCKTCIWIPGTVCHPVWA